MIWRRRLLHFQFVTSVQVRKIENMANNSTREAPLMGRQTLSWTAIGTHLKGPSDRFQVLVAVDKLTTPKLAHTQLFTYCPKGRWCAGESVTALPGILQQNRNVRVLLCLFPVSRKYSTYESINFIQHILVCHKLLYFVIGFFQWERTKT